MWSRRSLRGDAAITPTPRTAHQKAIVGGSAEPSGKGAAATVTNRMIEEILFDGGGFCAFVTFRPV
jgi:hypothetical protein